MAFVFKASFSDYAVMIKIKINDISLYEITESYFKSTQKQEDIFGPSIKTLFWIDELFTTIHYLTSIDHEKYICNFIFPGTNKIGCMDNFQFSH